MSKYLKRIQSYLSRKGVKVSQPDIRTIYQNIVSDVENPTIEEIAMVQNHFISASQAITPIEAVEEDTQPIDWQKELGVSSEDLGEATLPKSDEDTTQATTASTEPAPLTYPVDNAKREMVAYKAAEMGFTLAATEIEVIASHVNTSGSSFTQTIKGLPKNKIFQKKQKLASL